MTGKELFDKYAPPILMEEGWDAQSEDVQEAWSTIAAGVTAELARAKNTVE